jgi:ABC-type polysaccharide/polyol phosphate transport system ATPase subunit
MSEREYAVRLSAITKRFPSGDRPHSLFRTILGTVLTPEPGETFDALSSIDIEVLQGDRVGLIGNNGAGKSTLLRVVAGLYKPTSGKIEVRGERTLLAGLGVGMVDELSVEHNIFLYGAMHAVPRADLRDNLGEILEWAELREFRHTMLKNLSTGMRSRLAFSVTRYFTSDIYLLDEALTAGDRVFREKCDEVFEQYKRKGRTMLVATHDLSYVEGFCNKALWLHKGKQMSFGPPATVLPLYRQAAEAQLCPA